MRAHLSIYVSDVDKTAAFYSKVFTTSPQKKTHDYAKFDLKNPSLNFSFLSHPQGKISQVGHLGIEVDSTEEVLAWKEKLTKAGIETRDEMSVDCCYANQDKVWFSDPDGNEWEIFFVKNQLEIPKQKNTTTCAPKSNCCA